LDLQLVEDYFMEVSSCKGQHNTQILLVADCSLLVLHLLRLTFA